MAEKKATKAAAEKKVAAPKKEAVKAAAAPKKEAVKKAAAPKAAKKEALIINAENAGLRLVTFTRLWLLQRRLSP